MSSKKNRWCDNPECTSYHELVTNDVSQCPSCGEFTIKAPKSNSPLKVIIPVIIAIIVIVVFVLILLVHGGDDNSNINNEKNISRTVPKEEKVPKKFLFTIDGSTILGAKLVPALLEGFLKEHNYSDIKTIEDDATRIIVQGIAPKTNEKQSIEVTLNTTNNGFKSLSLGKCDIGLASRKVNYSELKDNISTSPANELVIALDGIAIIVNKENPLENITKENIEKIFTGEITNWKDINGINAPINVYSLNNISGTADYFQKFILQDKSISTKNYFENESLISKKIATDSNGIGFISFSNASDNKILSISYGAALHSSPNKFTIATEDYPISRRYYFYISSKNENSMVDKFVQYARSEQGQDIVSQTGLVSQNIMLEKNSDIISYGTWSNKDNEKRYESITSKCVARLSINFRFAKNSSELDNKALADIERVVSFLTKNEFSDYNVLLIGFTDSSGSYSENIRLSIERSESVKTQLINLCSNLSSLIITDGFGEEKPVAPNDSDENKFKNRRVEIWLVNK